VAFGLGGFAGGAAVRQVALRGDEDQLVVAVGGLGSLEGARVGALIVGAMRELGIAFFPEIELAVLYLIAAIVLLIRPAGLFGRP